MYFKKLGIISVFLVLFIFASAALAAYVGPEKCKTCHPDRYDLWKNTLHAKSIVNASDALAAGYPVPDGFNTADLKFTWPGKWKVRWVNKSGYLLTGNATQYNTVEKKFVAYEPGVTLGYNCGPCHTTGYDANGTMFQGQNAFKSGTWKIPGVTCERCHGEGSEHVNAPARTNIKVDRTSELCSDCHGRTEKSINLTITVLDPKRRHRVQYNDFFQSVMYKGGKNCINCHNSHSITDPLYADLGNKFDKDALSSMRSTVLMYYKGTDNSKDTIDYESLTVPLCAKCHVQESALYPNAPKVKLEHGTAKCLDCHMAKSRKTATEWDERTHTFKVDDKFNYSMSKIYMNYPDLTCKGCHPTMDFSKVTYGKNLHSIVKPTSTATTTAVSTALPTKSPGFETFVAIFAIVVLLFVRRR